MRTQFQQRAEHTREFRRAPQYSHHPSPLIYPLIICELELVDESARGNGRGTDNIATPLRRGRDENGIENHQTNLLPLSRVLVTSVPVSARTHVLARHVHMHACTESSTCTINPRAFPRGRTRACAHAHATRVY